MLRRFAPVAVIMVLVGSLASSVLAQDESRAQLIQLMKTTDRSPLSAMAVDRLMTLKFAPDVWQQVLDANNNEPRHNIVILADTLIMLANNMGWGDLVSVDRNGTYDGTSPLLPPMVDSWKDKLSATVSIPAGLDNKGKETAWQNISYMCAPIQSTYFCKPRSGKFFLTITVDPKATDLRFSLSKDAAQYQFALPAYVTISQYKVENALKQGM